MEFLSSFFVFLAVALVPVCITVHSPSLGPDGEAIVHVQEMNSTQRPGGFAVDSASSVFPFSQAVGSMPGNMMGSTAWGANTADRFVGFNESVQGLGVYSAAESQSDSGGGGQPRSWPTISQSPTGSFSPASVVRDAFTSSMNGVLPAVGEMPQSDMSMATPLGSFGMFGPSETTAAALQPVDPVRWLVSRQHENGDFPNVEYSATYGGQYPFMRDASSGWELPYVVGWPTRTASIAMSKHNDTQDNRSLCNDLSPCPERAPKPTPPCQPDGPHFDHVTPCSVLLKLKQKAHALRMQKENLALQAQKDLKTERWFARAERRIHAAELSAEENLRKIEQVDIQKKAFARLAVLKEFVSSPQNLSVNQTNMTACSINRTIPLDPCQVATPCRNESIVCG
eukprot:TRINITY_DN64270_c0_g1_i1.p1 TRINITY_DN64270_c0_g1~~TRINITY_DN64270_c0_g1_i1.p1  ORF type:complete len:397 (+),score=47.86 TRINITY_DN64270_c0_g1_i1:92-1282(+)